MTVFRWIMGVLAAVLAAGTVLSFAVFVASGIDLWVARARAMRRWTSAALLLWFNVEIWRSVVLTLIHW
jgi:hypothetical protein